MNWDFSVANLLTIVTALVGVGLTLALMKFRGDELWERSKEQEKQHVEQTRLQADRHAENQNKLVALELKIERETVKKDDFKAFEKTVSDKLDGINHTIGNLKAGIQSAAREAVRDLVPAARRRGGEQP